VTTRTRFALATSVFYKLLHAKVLLRCRIRGEPRLQGSRRRRTGSAERRLLAAAPATTRPGDANCLWIREAQKQAQLRAAIERERQAAAKRKAERERNAALAFSIERELRDRGVRTMAPSRTTRSSKSCLRSARRLQRCTTARRPRLWRTSCKRSSLPNSRAGCAVSSTAAARIALEELP
jgi:hypothetical protein